MEIQGKVIAVLPIKDGVGKTSGNEWKSREFVLETEESRPQSLCLQLMGGDRHQSKGGMRMNTGKKLFLCAGLLAFFLSVSAQSYSLRTNVIGLATTNLNLEASMTLNRKWSLHLPVQYNPFKFGRNRQFRNFYAAPGVRYWLLESYMGGFIGMYGTAGTYSVGNLFGNKYRYEGEGYGVGLSIGKAYQIGRRWNLEWEAGAGAVWLAYDKYLCKRCGDLVGQEYGWHFLPTRAALNVVYLF